MNDAGKPAAISGPLSAEELRLIDAWWRAANYLSVGQIYLLDNPLLKQPLALAHIKPRLLGHWGTTPGLKAYIRQYGEDMPEVREWRWSPAEPSRPDAKAS